MSSDTDPWDERLDAPITRLSQDAAADVDVEAALHKVKARFNEPQVLSFPSIRSTRFYLRAAVAAAAVIGGALYWKSANHAETGIVTGPAVQRFETGVGETHAIRLADGTRAVLGPSSHLIVSGGYGTDARMVELEGEALFDVQHDDAKPFSVRTRTATIRDIGTTFTVRTVGGSNVRVVVTAGSVILHGNDRGEGKGVVLHAGDHGLLDGEGFAAIFKGVVTPSDTAFVHGTLAFREARMTDVATELERWYGIHLVLNDPVLASRHITASFKDETKEQVVHVIGLALGVTIKLDGDTAHITPH